MSLQPPAIRAALSLVINVCALCLITQIHSMFNSRRELSAGASELPDLACAKFFALCGTSFSRTLGLFDRINFLEYDLGHLFETL